MILELGRLSLSTEMVEAMTGPLLNSIGYMFTWGGLGYNWGTAIQNALTALGRL